MVIYIIARGRIAIKGELDRSLEKILELIKEVYGLDSDKCVIGRDGMSVNVM